MSKNDWKAESTVTIPLEYFDELREREQEYTKLLRMIESCFEYDQDNGRTIVLVDPLVKLALEYTDGYFEGYMREESLCYDRINQERIANGAYEQLKEAELRKKKEELKKYLDELPIDDDYLGRAETRA